MNFSIQKSSYNSDFNASMFLKTYLVKFKFDVNKSSSNNKTTQNNSELFYKLVAFKVDLKQTLKIVCSTYPLAIFSLK